MGIIDRLKFNGSNDILVELNNLARKQEEYDNSHETFYYDNRFIEFKNFLERKLVKSLNKFENAKVIVNNLDIVLKYTNSNNMEWITYNSLLSQPNFLDNFIDNLKYFQYNDEMANLVCSLYVNFKLKFPEVINDFFNDKMLNALLDLQLDYYNYNALNVKMSDIEQEKFIKLSLEKKIPINLRYFVRNKKDMEFIYDNILEFASFSMNLFDLKVLISGNEVATQKFKKYMNEHPKQVIDSIFCESSDKYKRDEAFFDINNSTVNEVITMIINEIIQNEKANYSDISLITTGAYSLCIVIKDKIIKIGKTRETKKFPNNPYIIKPLIRKTINFDDTECFIEVMERVDTDLKVTNEELYILYKKLRDIGVIWTDIAPRNVGKLLKDNDINWNGNLASIDSALELESYRGNEVLKAGDLVLLDADYLFDENDPDIQYLNLGLSHRFARRYELDKKGIDTTGFFEDGYDSDKKTLRYTKSGFTVLRLILLISFSTVLISLILFLYFKNLF